VIIVPSAAVPSSSHVSTPSTPELYPSSGHWKQPCPRTGAQEVQLPCNFNAIPMEYRPITSADFIRIINGLQLNTLKNREFLAPALLKGLHDD